MQCVEAFKASRTRCFFLSLSLTVVRARLSSGVRVRGDVRQPGGGRELGRAAVGRQTVGGQAGAGVRPSEDHVQASPAVRGHGHHRRPVGEGK